MSKSVRGARVALALFCCVVMTGLTQSAAASGGMPTEYAMIRFNGMRYSQVVWPDGRVEFLDTLLGPLVHPDNLDERIYVLTLLINKLSKQGYDYVEMFSPDQVLMKRTH